MKLIGTSFQIKVWKEIIKIPKGKTKTYKEIAINIGHPNSARAVANACGKNPYPGTIPYLMNHPHISIQEKKRDIFSVIT